MFAPLFAVVLQTVIDRFTAEYGALISSFNDDVFGIVGGINHKWIYINRRIWFILKGLFSVSFMMVYGFVAEIFNEVFSGLTEYTLGQANGAFTKDCDCPIRRVVAAITRIVGECFGDTSSAIATLATAVVTMGIGVDIGFDNRLSYQRGGTRITTINGDYFNGFNDFDLAALSATTTQTEIEYNFTGVFREGIGSV